MGIEGDLAEKWQTKWGQVNYPFLTKRGTKRTSVKYACSTATFFMIV